MIYAPALTMQGHIFDHFDADLFEIISASSLVISINESSSLAKRQARFPANSFLT